jgi:O-Antigen ligase
MHEIDAARATWRNKILPLPPQSRCHVLIWMIAASWSITFVFGYQSALLAVSVLGLLVSLIGLTRPFIGMVGLGMLATLDPLSRGLLEDAGIWRWNTFNYLLLAISVLYCGVLVRRATKQHVLLLLFVLVLALDLFATNDLENGVQNLLGVASSFGLALYAMRVAGMSGVWYSLGLVNGFLAAFGGLFYYLEQAQLPYLNPNAFVHFPLAAIFSICLGLLEVRCMRQMRFLVLLAGLNLVWVFLSASRGGLVVGLLCSVFIGIRIVSMSPGGKSILTILAGGGATVLVLSVFSFSDLETKSADRILKIFDTERSVANRTSGRSDIAFAGWEMFKHHPLGVGTGNFDIAFADLDIEGLAFAGHKKQAHAGWIKILAENGVPGVVLLIFFVSSFALAGRKARKSDLRQLGYLTSAVLAIALLSTEFQSKDLWLLAMTVIAILQNRTRPVPQSRAVFNSNAEQGEELART